MLNPIFWKNVQGQKHPGRSEIEERKIPSVKMLFKTNTNGHKHPSISLIIIEQDTIGETKEHNKWHSTREPRTPQNQVTGNSSVNSTASSRQQQKEYQRIPHYWAFVRRICPPLSTIEFPSQRASNAESVSMPWVQFDIIFQETACPTK